MDNIIINELPKQTMWHLLNTPWYMWSNTTSSPTCLTFTGKIGRINMLNFFFFLFSFAYTTSPAAVMKLVVFLRSSKPPYNFWWSGVADGHCAIRSGWCMLHLWRTCSVVWSSSPQGHTSIKAPNSQQDLL